MDDGRSLNDVKDEVRRDAALRSASVGPLVAIAQLLREYCRLDAELRGVIERLPYELELHDARLRLAYGERWCDDVNEVLLRRDTGDDDGRV